MNDYGDESFQCRVCGKYYMEMWLASQCEEFDREEDELAISRALDKVESEAWSEDIHGKS